MYYEEDTPRSARSVGYGSPRDDRFYTPRTVAVARSNSNSNSEEWVTPRYETPRFGNNGYNSQSDNEFQTPRTARELEERKMDRKEIYPTLLKRASLNSDSPRIYESPYMAQGKGNHQPSYGSKDIQQKGEAGYYPPPNYPSHVNPAPRAQSKQIEEENDEEYISLDLAAAGLSEKDVEDVFSYARHGRCEEIERLFAKGLPVDVRNDHGNTVLIVACQNGNKRVAKAVLRRGANINARNHKGNTPLHYCYHYGYGDTLGQYLMSKGADGDARNNAGKTIDQGI